MSTIITAHIFFFHKDSIRQKKVRMPSNEKIIIAILVIIIVSLSIYSYNTHIALMADVKRREEAEAKVVKLETYGFKLMKEVDFALMRGELSKQTTLSVGQAARDLRDSMR